MFIQQPFRIQADPIIPQQATLLDNALRMHYTAKAQEYSTDVVRVHRIEVLNPVLVEGSTQIDLLVSVEADTIDFFEGFVRAFIRQEQTDSMYIQPL